MGDSTVKSIFSSIDSIITFALVCIEAVLICFLEGFVVNNHLALVSNCQVNNTPAAQSFLGVSESDLIYHSLFIVSQVFQVILCIDALYHKNTAQLCTLIVFGLLVVV
ncbi:hypothetical protein VTP01DRAFT_9828 [Rhizomucor pusillus]|uniref:uncharacterized protein n=1 Tax=Rhizomucor pusillus TaxID=4840 RepID=UPI003743593D